MMKLKTLRGVTLVELVVVMSIIGILAGIVYPSYTQSLQGSSRAEAQAALMGLAAAMDRHYAVNNTYKGAGKDGGDTGTPTIFGGAVPLDVSDTSKQTYTLTISAADASSFTLQAAPKNRQASDKCGTLTLNQAFTRGIKGASTGVTVDSCWKK